MIVIENLGKKYQLGRRGEARPYALLREVIVEKFRELMGRAGLTTRNSSSEGSTSPGEQAAAANREFWALRSVSLNVAPGEVVGIIGRNGAGKSTLLKILSRITEPTEGRVRLRGRVASLLEVGTGFHPELTGRENIFLNGAILGMSRAEIMRKFDEIVAFAEVARFLDTPVKRYSSGMYVRLAFAVAAHLEPEILIVDEVLAVGDVEFQRKCLGKMQAVSRGGRTVLFVSHNLSVVQSLCQRVVYLRDGRVQASGDPDAMVSRYLADAAPDSSRAFTRPLDVAEIRVARFALEPNPVKAGGALRFRVEIQAAHSTRLSELAILIYSAEGRRVAILDLRRCGLPQTLRRGESWAGTGWIGAVPLVEGEYRVGLFVSAGAFRGDLHDLVSLTVTLRQGQGAHPEYPAAHRGLIELEFDAEGTVKTEKRTAEAL